MRDLRALIAQRAKMGKRERKPRTGSRRSCTATTSCRPKVSTSTPADVRNWWLLLPVTPMEKVRVQCDLDTLAFAKGQVAQLSRPLPNAPPMTSGCLY